MTTPPAQAEGYPTWPQIEGNLSVVDVPGGSGAYGNIYARSVGLITPAGLVEALMIMPSGDPTGVTDDTNVLNALNNAQYVVAGPGQFFQGGRAAGWPVQTAQTFIGCGMRTTSITYVGSLAAAAQLLVGQSSIVQNCTVGGFQLFGNANSGHSIQWRAKIANLQDVILQSPQSACLRLDPAAISGTISQVFMKNVQGIHPGTDGIYTDTHVSDSDFFGFTFDGGISGDTAVGSNIGFNLTGGSNNRYHGAHAYLFANGGASITGTSQMFYGGELESNGTADAIWTNAHHCVMLGVAFYDHVNAVPPSQHHLFTGTASTKIDIADCDWREDTYSVPAFYTNSNASTGINFHDCPGFNPVGVVTPPTYTAGTATTNPFPHACRVFVTGATAIAINGTATGLAAPAALVLGPGETITPTGAGAWLWQGL